MNDALRKFLDDGGDTRKIPQGSDIWKDIRRGFVTASGVTCLLSKAKNGETAMRGKYKMQLVAERLSQEKPETFVSQAMEWGIKQEQFAAIAYEAKSDVLTDKTGFWLHPTIDWVGVSPDRLVNEDGLIEIKCPNTTTHIGYIFDNKIPTGYYHQIQCQLWVTGRKWCDFVSFDPRLPSRNQLLIIRTKRDEELISEMESEVIKFLAEVETLVNQCER